MKYEYADLGKQAPLYFKQALLLAILAHIFFFLVVPTYAPKVIKKRKIETFETKEWKAVEQKKEYKAPKAKKVNVAVNIEIGSEDIDEDVTIEETTVDVYKPAPVVEKDDIIPDKFIPYDEPPVPIRKVAPVYPEMARKAEIEGRVMVKIFVDKTGRVRKAIVVKSVQPGPGGLDEAAVKAVKRWRFKPAKQRDKAVGVWYVVPINFKLN